jgi:hypothetical protein
MTKAPLDPNSLKGILAAAGSGLLLALALLAAPVAVGVSPWFVILPVAFAVMIVCGIDSCRHRDASPH